MNDFKLLIDRNKQFGIMHGEIERQKMIFPWDNLCTKVEWAQELIQIKDLARKARLLSQRKFDD